MSDSHNRRLKNGEKQLKRKVEHLHPTVHVELSPADIAYYRSLGPWAMVLDRQSKKAELTREEATGQANRVRNVLQMAEQAQLTLPAPTENTQRKEGEFQFSFEADPCKYHWFVDGQKANASGFTASPSARLQLWRAAKIARILRDHGCAPRVILIGELTRFFRDQTQFLDWYQILKNSGASVQIYGCPELTPDTEEMLLPMYLSQVAALSAWLKKQNQMARETRRQRGELFKVRAPFGLRFNLDKASPGYRREVFPHPVEWPVLQELIARTVGGELQTACAAMQWFVETCEARGVEPKRIPHSRRWLYDTLTGDLLRGVYYQYCQRYTPCRVEDDEMRSDWDHSPGGNRRYDVRLVMDEAVQFPILLSPAQAIGWDDLQLARKLLTQRGKPRREGQEADVASLLSDGLITCAVCGHTVLERSPRRKPERAFDRSTRASDELLLSLLYQGMTSREIAEVMDYSVRRINKRRSRMQFSGQDRAADEARLRAYWEDPFRRLSGAWHLYCMCIAREARKQNKSVEEVEQLPVAQHSRRRNGSITLALEPLLWQALQADPILDLEEGDVPLASNLPALEAEESRILTQIRKIQSDYEADNWTFYTQDEAIARMARLRQEHARVASQIAAAKGSLLDANDVQEQRAWEDTRRRLCRMLAHPGFQQSITFRRQLVQMCVKRVVMDMETGTFEADTHFTPAALQRLCGTVLMTADDGVNQGSEPRLTPIKNKSVTLRGHVRLAA